MIFVYNYIVNVTLALEFCTYTLPALVAIIATYQIYLRKKKYIDLFYISLLSLPLALITASIKTIFILTAGLTESTFLSGNLLYFILLCFASVFAIRKLAESSALKISNYEIAGIFVLVLAAIFTRSAIKAIDLIVYGTIGFVILHIGYVIYSLILRSADSKGVKITKISFVLSLFAICSDILLKILYYFKIIPLFPTIQVSLSLRVVGTLLVVLLAIFLGSQIPASEPPKEVASNRKRTAWRASLITFAISVAIVGIIFSTFTRTRTYEIDHGNAITLGLAYNVNESYGEFDYLINEAINGLTYLSGESNVLLSEASREKEMIAFYESHKSLFASLTFMNTKGVIEFTYPFTSSIGADISSQPHVKSVLATKQITLSDPIMSVQAFPALIIHVPAFLEKQFVGTVAGLIDARQFKNYITKVLPATYDILLAEDNIVLSTNIDNSLILKPLQDTLSQINISKYFSKSFAFTLLNKHFEIFVLSDKASFVSDVKANNVNQWSAVFFLVTLLLYVLYQSTEALRREDDELSNAVEAAVERETGEKNKVISLQAKLNDLSQFILATSIDMPEEEFFSNLLKTSTELIPNVQKGSAWLRKGEYVCPVASCGFDMTALKDIKLNANEEYNKWKFAEVYRVGGIGIESFKGENKTRAIELGMQSIKQTIIIPIIIDNEYVGGVFFDNLESEDVFNDEDIALSKTVMKLVNYYISERKMIGEIKNAVKNVRILSEDLQSLIEFQSNVSFLEAENVFFGKLLELSLSIILHAEKGSVYLRDGGLLKPIAWIGYPDGAMQELEILVERELDVIKQGEALIIKNIGVNDFATAEQRELARQMGSTGIKATIHAPIFIGSDYYGGIFLDSYKSEDAFDQSDLFVVHAISNISSLYIRTKTLLYEQERGILRNTIVVEIINAVGSSKTREEASSAVFQSIFKHFPKAIKAIWIFFQIEDRHVLFCSTEGKSFYKTIETMPSFLDGVKQSVIKDDPEIISQCLDCISLGGRTKNDKGVIREYGKYKGVNPLEKSANWEGVKNIYIVPAGKERFLLYAFDVGLLNSSERNTLDEISVDIANAIENFEISVEMDASYIEILISLAKAIDSKDPYTREHSEGVTNVAYLIGRRIGLANKDMKNLLYASILHDIGKIGIPEAILQKPGKLTNEEFEIVKEHPSEGAEIIGSIDFLKGASVTLLHHHERYDGRGYPSKLKGDEIPFLSRIIAVADSFDAMTTARPYRSAKNFEEAVEEIKKCKGSQFDPEIVDAFLMIPKEEIESFSQNTTLSELFAEVISLEYENKNTSIS